MCFVAEQTFKIVIPIIHFLIKLFEINILWKPVHGPICTLHCFIPIMFASWPSAVKTFVLKGLIWPHSLLFKSIVFLWIIVCWQPVSAKNVVGILLISHSPVICNCCNCQFCVCWWKLNVEWVGEIERLLGDSSLEYFSWRWFILMGTNGWEFGLIVWLELVCWFNYEFNCCWVWLLFVWRFNCWVDCCCWVWVFVWFEYILCWFLLEGFGQLLL